MIAGKRYSTVTGKEITPAQDFADGYAEGYEEAVADIVAWLRIKYPRATSVPAQIERGDAKGAAGKAWR